MIKLIFLSGPLSGHRFAIDHDVTLGRDASNDIVIPDPAVSLVHCQILFSRDGVSVKDLGSTNGIRVNGMRVVSEQINDGDGLFVGKSRIRVEWIGSQPPGQDSVHHVARLDEESREDALTEMTGNIFGSVTYYLKRRIAKGGMGAIYEAEQFGAEGFIKSVAIKTILPSYVRKKSFVSSFVGEAKLVANLVHPNIVQIHHLGRHEGGYYIAMEYLDGIDLNTFIAAHKQGGDFIPVDLALLIVSRVCQGLDYAHRKTGTDGHPLHLVHRDVSPSNIMITRDGEVKLTDFGVAKAAHFMEDDEQYLVGCVEYMSPEQAACEDVDARSDIFSLGLVAYELLTNVRVYAGPENEDDASGAVERTALAEMPDLTRLRSDVPSRVVDIVAKCLQKDPDQRYASAADLAADVDAELFSLGRRPTTSSLSMYLASMGLPNGD